MTKMTLMNSMFLGLAITLTAPNGDRYLGYVMGMQLEDGSGSKFIVTFRVAGEKNCRKIFVKTID